MVTPNPTLGAAIQVGQVFGYSPTGGHLKIVLVDGDVTDTDLAMCEIAIAENVQGAAADQREAEWECVRALRRLRVADRMRLTRSAK